MLNATYSCKMKISFQIELNILNFHKNWFLGMCNTYLQETAIKISKRFPVKSYKTLKINITVYITCGFLLILILD